MKFKSQQTQLQLCSLFYACTVFVMKLHNSYVCYITGLKFLWGYSSFLKLIAVSAMFHGRRKRSIIVLCCRSRKTQTFILWNKAVIPNFLPKTVTAMFPSIKTNNVTENTGIYSSERIFVIVNNHGSFMNAKYCCLLRFKRVL